MPRGVRRHATARGCVGGWRSVGLVARRPTRSAAYRDACLRRRLATATGEGDVWWRRVAATFVVVTAKASLLCSLGQGVAALRLSVRAWRMTPLHAAKKPRCCRRSYRHRRYFERAGYTRGKHPEEAIGIVQGGEDFERYLCTLVLEFASSDRLYDSFRLYLAFAPVPRHVARRAPVGWPMHPAPLATPSPHGGVERGKRLFIGINMPFHIFTPLSHATLAHLLISSRISGFVSAPQRHLFARSRVGTCACMAVGTRARVPAPTRTRVPA
jgi:hypothetical protein